MKTTIRLATEADAEGINQVSSYLGYSELSDDKAKDKLFQMCTSTSDEVYVCEMSGNIVGWLHLFYARRLASDDFYEIGGLVVHPEFRVKGIGRALVAHVLETHKGKLRVRCNEKRLESHQFYEAIGFVRKKAQCVFEAG